MVVEDGTLSYYGSNTGDGLKGAVDLAGAEVLNYSENTSNARHIIYVNTAKGNNDLVFRVDTEDESKDWTQVLVDHVIYQDERVAAARSGSSGSVTGGSAPGQERDSTQGRDEPESGITSKFGIKVQAATGSRRLSMRASLKRDYDLQAGMVRSSLKGGSISSQVTWKPHTVEPGPVFVIKFMGFKDGDASTSAKYFINVGSCDNLTDPEEFWSPAGLSAWLASDDKDDSPGIFRPVCLTGSKITSVDKSGHSCTIIDTLITTEVADSCNHSDANASTEFLERLCLEVLEGVETYHSVRTEGKFKTPKIAQRYFGQHTPRVLMRVPMFGSDFRWSLCITEQMMNHVQARHTLDEVSIKALSTAAKQENKLYTSLGGRRSIEQEAHGIITGLSPSSSSPSSGRDSSSSLRGSESGPTQTSVPFGGGSADKSKPQSAESGRSSFMAPPSFTMGALFGGNSGTIDEDEAEDEEEEGAKAPPRAPSVRPSSAKPVKTASSSRSSANHSQTKQDEALVKALAATKLAKQAEAESKSSRSGRPDSVRGLRSSMKASTFVPQAVRSVPVKDRRYIPYVVIQNQGVLARPVPDRTVKCQSVPIIHKTVIFAMCRQRARDRAEWLRVVEGWIIDKPHGNVVIAPSLGIVMVEDPTRVRLINYKIPQEIGGHVTPKKSMFSFFTKKKFDMHFHIEVSFEPPGPGEMHRLDRPYGDKRCVFFISRSFMEIKALEAHLGLPQSYLGVGFPNDLVGQEELLAQPEILIEFVEMVEAWLTALVNSGPSCLEEDSMRTFFTPSRKDMDHDNNRALLNTNGLDGAWRDVAYHEDAATVELYSSLDKLM